MQDSTHTDAYTQHIHNTHVCMGTPEHMHVRKLTQNKNKHLHTIGKQNIFYFRKFDILEFSYSALWKIRQYIRKKPPERTKRNKNMWSKNIFFCQFIIQNKIFKSMIEGAASRKLFFIEKEVKEDVCSNTWELW